MASLQLEVVTPEAVVVSREVEYINLPGIEGEFGILPEHIPFLSALSIGGMHYNAEGKTVYLFISGGFAEVSNNKVSVLAEAAEMASEINADRAQAALDRARKRIESRQAETIDIIRAEAALKRATTRLSLLSR